MWFAGNVKISKTRGDIRTGVERERAREGVWRWIKRGEGKTSVAALYPDYGWPPCAFREERVIWQPFARARSRERVRIWNYVLVYSAASVIMRTVMTPRATTRAVKLHFQFMKRQLYGEVGGVEWLNMALRNAIPRKEHAKASRSSPHPHAAPPL